MNACLHPIVVDLESGSAWWRACAMCELTYNRSEIVLGPLHERCERAWKIDFRKIRLDDEDALEIAG